MPTLALLKHFLAELTSRKDAVREPEPNLIMSDPDQAAAFHEAGREHGVMAPVYLFHAIHICTVIRPGDIVVDLGCGPANQLGLVARLNPDVKFVGVDFSDEMLEIAHQNLKAAAIENVTLQHGDITELEGAMSDVDAVMSTVTLHHLPTEQALFRCFHQVQRIAKPEGGLYLVDFGHLRTEAAIRYFAYQYEDRQPEIFTTDYLNSLRAAFDLSTWRQGWERHLKERGSFHATFAMPYMVAIKSAPRRSLSHDARKGLASFYENMPHYHQQDFRHLCAFFRYGGLKTPSVHE